MDGLRQLGLGPVVPRRPKLNSHAGYEGRAEKVLRGTFGFSLAFTQETGQHLAKRLAEANRIGPQVWNKCSGKGGG